MGNRSFPVAYPLFHSIRIQRVFPGKSTRQPLPESLPACRGCPLPATAAAPWLPADTAPLISVRAVIWCVGSILCAGFFIITYLHCRMEFQASFPVCSDFTEKWLKEHTLRRTVSIRQSDQDFGPPYLWNVTSGHTVAGNKRLGKYTTAGIHSSA